MKAIIKILLIGIIVASVGCGGDEGNLPCLHCDGGEGCNISGYRTVQIGNQTWMAENLNCDVSGSKCYDNSPANCAKYGRLYNWSTANTVCPYGWHLPGSSEWAALFSYVHNSSGTSNSAGKYLKAIVGWGSDYSSDANGEDAYGFAAFPGGYYGSGSYKSAGTGGYWWSASAGGSTSAELRGFVSYEDKVSFHTWSRSNLLSVRCVKD